MLMSDVASTTLEDPVRPAVHKIIKASG